LKFHELDLTGAPGKLADDWFSLHLPAAYEPGLVSVIIPSYNRAAFLADAIDSVWNQTYRPIELLVVDDGSTDQSGEAVRHKLAGLPNASGFCAYYLRQPNRGASAARNQGLLHSHGEFIQYLDSDDVLVRHKLARHVDGLQSNKTLDLVWSDWLVLPSERVREELQRLNEDQVSRGNHWQMTDRLIPWEPWPTLARRRFISGRPLWNENTSRWDDWEYALRLLAANPKRGFSSGTCCIQRTHNQGRRYDFDLNPEGVDVGLNTCREAVKVYQGMALPNAQIRQLIANRFWETGLEALLRGTEDQAAEAFGNAAKLGTRMWFRVKGAGAWLAMKSGGKVATKALLTRYLPNKAEAENGL